MERKMTLEQKVKGYWTGREKNSAYGLALLDQSIREFAEKGNWDPLARFVVASMKVGQGVAVKRVIRAAFGNHLAFTTDSKHDTGGKFTKINWNPEWKNVFPLGQSNTYGYVTKAIEQGRGWDSKILAKELDAVVAKAPKPVKVVDAEAQTKEAKALATKLKALRDAGFDLGALVREAQSLLAANPQANADKSVEKKVVNGETVYEPAH